MKRRFPATRQRPLRARARSVAARKYIHADSPRPMTSAAAIAPPAARSVLLRRTNLRKRYAADGGQACTGSSCKIALDVGGQAVGRLVAAVAVLFQALHHDPVELAADVFAQAGRFGVRDWRRSMAACRCELSLRAGLGRLLLADDPQHFVEGGLAQSLAGRTASMPVSSS